MNENQVIEYFKECGALLEGHFVLSSGLHSPKYCQCARAMMDTNMAEKLCSSLAKKIAEKVDISQVNKVVAPAMGGVLVGYETARHLNKPSIFCERVNGQFEFRRGFSIEQGDKVVIIEDVVTTGKSSLETVKTIEALGGQIVAEGCLIDRSNGASNLDFPLISLAKIDIPTYKEGNLPQELKDKPVEKPGSRFIKN